MNSSITIGTRGSQLALWQAEFVKKQFAIYFPELPVSLKIIKTTGDIAQNRPILGLGRGVFTKEIETALLKHEIDLAVHSLKDLPTELPAGLCLAAIPVREDARDVLITSSGLTLGRLPEGAKIGTTSPRRKAQLLHTRPDLQIQEVRGNIDTRLRKLHETQLDGLILAAAGIKRLRKTASITQFLDRELMVPAVGQGALAIETRQQDRAIAKLVALLNNARAETEITAERTVLERLGGGCNVPIGANAMHVAGELSLIATVCHPEGTRRIVERATAPSNDAQLLGELIADKLRTGGAAQLLKM